MNKSTSPGLFLGAASAGFSVSAGLASLLSLVSTVVVLTGASVVAWENRAGVSRYKSVSKIYKFLRRVFIEHRININKRIPLIA